MGTGVISGARPVQITFLTVYVGVVYEDGCYSHKHNVFTSGLKGRAVLPFLIPLSEGELEEIKKKNEIPK